MHASEIESCRDPCQAGGVLFHIVELRDLRGGLSKEGGHLPGEREPSVPSGCLMLLTRLAAKQSMELPPLLQLSRLQDAVVPFGYSLRARQR